MVKGARAAAGSSTPSTSSPRLVSVSVISPSDAVVSRWSFNQDSVNFMISASMRQDGSADGRSAGEAGGQAGDVERHEAVMLQPAQIGVVEGAQVGDAVFQHRRTLDPHAEGEALVAGGIDAAGLQHLRMDHAAAEDLEPVAVIAQLQLAALARTADIDLGRGLGEREEAGTEPDRQVRHVEE